jgi:hypothetical protein
MLGNFMTAEFRLSQVISCYIRSAEVKAVYVRLGKFRSG